MPSKNAGTARGCNSSCGGCAGGGTGAKTAETCPRPGCCGSRGACGGCAGREIVLSQRERDFLLLLGQIPFLPLARLVGRQVPEDGMTPVLQAPVYLDTPDDSPETVREMGEILLALEAKRLVTLDYDKPLQNGDYSMFSKSRFYQERLAADPALSSVGPPVFEFGSIALTALGQAALDSI